MITPSDFMRRWNALDHPPSLTKLLPAALGGLNLDADSQALLTEAGIPEDAAPCLGFQEAAPGLLRTAADVYKPRNQPGKILFDGVLKALGGSKNVDTGKAPDPLQRYRVIGSDDVGSPLCIDSATGRVVCLDHERRFEAEPVNTTMAALLESLLVYAELIQRVMEQRGEDAWLDANVAQDKVADLAVELRRIDPPSVQPNTFWGKELTRLGLVSQY